MKKKVYRERYNISKPVKADVSSSVTYRTDIPTITGIDIVTKYETKKPTKKKVGKK